MRPVPRETSQVKSNDRQRLQIGAGTCRWSPQFAHLWIRNSRAAHASQNPAVPGSGTGKGMPSGKYRGSVTGQDQRARRWGARAAHDQAMASALDLRGRRPPELPDALDHEAQPVDVGLGEVPTRGVDRQAAVRPVDGSRLDEGTAFAARAEAEILERHDDLTSEVLVDLGHVDILGSDASLPVELAGDRRHARARPQARPAWLPFASLPAYHSLSTRRGGDAGGA